MAVKIKTSKRKVKNGIKVTATAKLDCDYEISEAVTQPTEAVAKAEATNLVRTRIAGHTKWCRGKGTH